MVLSEFVNVAVTVAVPLPTDVTIPEFAPTVTTLGLLDVHAIPLVVVRVSFIPPEVVPVATNCWVAPVDVKVKGLGVTVIDITSAAEVELETVTV